MTHLQVESTTYTKVLAHSPQTAHTGELSHWAVNMCLMFYGPLLAPMPH